MSQQNKHVFKLADAQHGDTIKFRGEVKVELRHKEGGEPFLFLILSDNSGSATAICWNESNLYSFFKDFDEDDKIEAHGQITKKGKFTNINLTSATVLERDDDWVVHLKKLETALGKVIRNIKHDGLRNMLFEYFTKHHKEYFKAPATLNGGGSFKGGSLASVVRLCRLIDSTWNSLNLFAQDFNVNQSLKSDFNKDLLKTVALLEAVGKVETYEVVRSKVRLTKKGELLSDRVVTMKIVQSLLDNSSLNEDEKLLFLHLLAAMNEGETFSGQVVAKSREAVILNSLYQLNLQLMLFEKLDKDRAVDAPEDEFYFNRKRNYFLTNFDELETIEDEGTEASSDEQVTAV